MHFRPSLSWRISDISRRPLLFFFFFFSSLRASRVPPSFIEEKGIWRGKKKKALFWVPPDKGAKKPSLSRLSVPFFPSRLASLIAMLELEAESKHTIVFVPVQGFPRPPLLQTLGFLRISSGCSRLTFLSILDPFPPISSKGVKRGKEGSQTRFRSPSAIPPPLQPSDPDFAEKSKEGRKKFIARGTNPHKRAERVKFCHSNRRRKNLTCLRSRYLLSRSLK